jgi:hypothetical protein
MEMEALLRKNLHRALCPDPVVLGEYQMGSLPAEQNSVIHSHLEDCPRCKSELKLMENYFNDLKPDIEYSLGERVRIWIAQLLPQAGAELAFGVRGEENSSLLRYQIGDREETGELVIEVQEDAAHLGRKTILGLLTGINGEGMQASLWQNGQAVTETSLDAFGNLALTNLLPGVYDLLIRGGEIEIYAQNLKV